MTHTGAGTDNEAVMAGYTRHVLLEADNACISFAALIKPDTDLDARFVAFDTDNQEWLAINGWLWSVEDAD